VLAASGRPCLVSAREPLPAIFAEQLPAPVVLDAYGDVGPLGALASAAAVVRTPLLFAAAGDLANIDASVIDELEHRYQEERERVHAPDAVLPRHQSGEVEPLAALYDTRRLRERSAQLLARGQAKVTALLQGWNVAYLDISPARADIFHNVNHKGDLAGIRP
jgi:molybdopterin-guanine dinucleotide biosynthesis protein A